MEPFRPAVDRVVRRLWRNGQDEVTADAKAELATVLVEAQRTDRRIAPLSRCVEWAARSLAQSLLAGEDRLRLPTPAALG